MVGLADKIHFSWHLPWAKYLIICNSILGIGEAKMDWTSRLKVALGAAKGLAYLHTSSAVGIPIVHRDFKSTNVLLSANFEAKVINWETLHDTLWNIGNIHTRSHRCSKTQIASFHRYLILGWPSWCLKVRRLTWLQEFWAHLATLILSTPRYAFFSQ